MADFKEIIVKKVNEIVEKVKGDPEFAKKFTSEPVKAVEGVIGVDLPDEAIDKVVDGVKAKLAVGKAGDLLDGVKKLF